MMGRRYGLRKTTFMLFCLSFLIEVDVNAVSPCINRIGLLERLVIPSGLDEYIDASSFTPPHVPDEVSTSGIGWCSDDPTCDSGENQFIEVDFGAEVIIEAIAILRAGGGYVTHCSIEYAGSDEEYHCISERIPSNIVFNENGACSLNMQPSEFNNSVIARYVRVIPIQWVGASACLRMELYGCTIEECQTESIQLPYSADASSFSPTSIVNQIFYLSNPWCASFPVKVLEIITLNFSSSVYLTRLRVRGTLVNASIYYRAINGSDVLYHNAAGIASLELSFNTEVIPLWPAINTTLLQFHLYATSSDYRVCFAVELTGCLSSNVIDHVEDTTARPMSADIIGTCDRPHSILSTLPTPSEPATTNTATSNYQSTACPSVVTVTATVEVTASAMVQQQSEASNDSNDDCNIIAIVVPTVLVFIAILVVICISIMVVKIIWKRNKGEDNNTTSSLNPHTSFVVENDLYQSQSTTEKTTNTGISSQYSVVGPPNSPTVSGEDDVQVFTENSEVGNNRQSVQYDYLTQPPVDGYTPTAEYEVIVDAKQNSTEDNDTYSVPKAPVLTANPAYATCDVRDEHAVADH